MRLRSRLRHSATVFCRLRASLNRRLIPPALVVCLFLLASPVSSVPAATAEIAAKRFNSIFSSREDNGAYPLFDSKTVIHTFGVGQPQFYWANNEELLLVPMHIVSDPSAPNKERYSYTVSRWNVRTGTSRVLHSVEGARPRLCYFDGYLIARFEASSGRRIRLLHGVLGQEQEDDPDLHFNDVVCRPLNAISSLPAWTRDREVRWLQSLDAGFIDFGELNRSRHYGSLQLYRHGAKRDEGIQLPFYDGLVQHRFPYYAFKDAFFVIGQWSASPDAPYPIYWLYRDGRVEKIGDIPPGPWRRGSLSVTPTRVGMLLASSHFRNPNRPEHAGLYLFSGASVEKLISGWIEGLAIEVSPDGCKAAFAVSPVVTRKANVLKAIDICARRPR